MRDKEGYGFFDAPLPSNKLVGLLPRQNRSWLLLHMTADNGRHTRRREKESMFSYHLILGIAAARSRNSSNYLPFSKTQAGCEQPGQNVLGLNF
jgi:hypothetical protein